MEYFVEFKGRALLLFSLHCSLSLSS